MTAPDHVLRDSTLIDVAGEAVAPGFVDARAHDM